MKIQIKIDQRAALAKGIDASDSTMSVTITPYSLSMPERVYLAAHLDEKMRLDDAPFVVESQDEAIAEIRKRANSVEPWDGASRSLIADLPRRIRESKTLNELAMAIPGKLWPFVADEERWKDTVRQIARDDRRRLNGDDELGRLLAMRINELFVHDEASLLDCVLLHDSPLLHHSDARNADAAERKDALKRRLLELEREYMTTDVINSFRFPCAQFMLGAWAAYDSPEPLLDGGMEMRGAIDPRSFWQRPARAIFALAGWQWAKVTSDYLAVPVIPPCSIWDKHSQARHAERFEQLAQVCSPLHGLRLEQLEMPGMENALNLYNAGLVNHIGGFWEAVDEEIRKGVFVAKNMPRILSGTPNPDGSFAKVRVEDFPVLATDLRLTPTSILNDIEFGHLKDILKSLPADTKYQLTQCQYDGGRKIMLQLRWLHNGLLPIETEVILGEMPPARAPELKLPY